MRFSLSSLADTHALANYLLEHSSDHQLIVLKGPLGAGKTTLMQFLAKALASPASVTSPTYTLIHEYPSPAGLLVHIDAYRLGRADALFELGLEDYLDRAKLVVVEWGEGLIEHFPEAMLVTLSFDGDGRSAEVKHTSSPTSI